MNTIELPERATSARELLPEIRFRPHHFTVFVPSHNGHGLIPNQTRERALKHCREVICQIGGGATEWEAKGYWLGQDGFVSESITVITSFVTCDKKRISTRLRKLCLWMKAILQQEKVAFEVDSRLYLI